MRRGQRGKPQTSPPGILRPESRAVYDLCCLADVTAAHGARDGFTGMMSLIGSRWVKRAGEEFIGDQRELCLADEQWEEEAPYERLLGDAMDGDATLFTREDAVEAAWAVVDPVLKTHHRGSPYKRGSWGPKGADALIERDGGWHNPLPPTSESKKAGKKMSRVGLAPIGETDENVPHDTMHTRHARRRRDESTTTQTQRKT